MALSDTEFQLHSFADLTALDLYQIMQLRAAIFVLEQNCAYQDIDDLDQEALHVYKKADNGKIFAYARILTPEQTEQHHSSIGRVVVKQSHRQGKVGKALMEAAIKFTTERFPNHPLKISAQTYLSHFYQNLGFINTGHFYLEDQIPHQEMLYQPNKI
jgi:ElaA protein